MTISDSWLETVNVVNSAPGRHLYHLVTCIDDPLTEDPDIRAAIDELSQELPQASVETVANTIFPIQLARSSRDPAHLTQRYRNMYPTLQRLHRNNQRGTYFSRIISHPSSKGEHDQLAQTISRLNTELSTPGPKSARYEMNISDPHASSDEAGPDETQHRDASSPIHVYAPGVDNSPMGFPCLSFCSFQLERNVLHLVAHYRRQHLIERGYGNYLGLGRLLGYICDMTDLQPGQLMIVAGVGAVDSPKYRIAQLNARASESALLVSETGS
ncbi:thymidylate synthase family protein [Actinoallomurus bryophytorum]|nr:hypothetical protein [Actinoallomurus bryophytorum]